MTASDLNEGGSSLRDTKPVAETPVVSGPTPGQIGRFITFNPSGEYGNAVVSPEQPADGVYWTLIGSGPDLDQNELAQEIVSRLNVSPPEMDERAAFESWYCADAALSGLEFWPADIAAMRDGDEYGSQRVAINSKWEGWKARAAISRATGEA